MLGLPPDGNPRGRDARLGLQHPTPTAVSWVARKLM